MFEFEENDAYLDSSRDQRIQERRLRIEQRRNNRQKKPKDNLKKVNENKEKEENNVAQPTVDIVKNTKGSHQIVIAKNALENLGNMGEILTTNVLIDFQSREFRLRQEDAMRLKELDNKRLNSEMEENKINSQILNSWSKIETVGGNNYSEANPYVIQELFDSQKELCRQLVTIKDNLANEYKNELKFKDEQYVKEIKKQSGEIDLIIEKMNTQFKSIKIYIREALEQIELSFVQDRNELINNLFSEIDKIVQKRRSDESKYYETYPERAEEHILQTDQARISDLESYNAIKIKMENDIQILEQQLQQMRATYQLNSEKLEYNYQVLKKRDEENGITITTHKRKINRLNDLVNIMKVKSSKQETFCEKDFLQLTEDYKRVMEQFKELQSKFSKFQALDNTKFQELRKMNEEDAQELVRKIISADKIIWGKILQSTTEWKCPESLNNVLNKFLNSMNSGTISSQNDSKSSILSYSNEIQSSKSLKRLSLSFDEYMTLFSSPETKNFLQLLTEETSGFLVEKKLLDLLAPLEKEEQFLMKLDCIFKALGINSISQIESLENMFFVSESAEESEKFTSQTSSAEKKRSLISPQKVIPTLQIFIESLKKNHSTPDDKPILVNVSSEVESDEKYWRSVADVLNGKYFRIWDAVHNGLLLYHDLLLKRMKNAEDIKMLERENMELRALLHMNSKSDVMKELQIPPTEFNYIKKE